MNPSQENNDECQKSCCESNKKSEIDSTLISNELN